MTSFLMAAAALVAATLLLLLRPWRRRTVPDTGTAQANTGIYRDQLHELDRDLAAGTISAPDHAQARAELQRRLLEDTGAGDSPQAAMQGMRATALTLALVLPLAGAGLYAWLGTPAALDPAATKVVTQEDVEKMVASLAARLEKDPSDTKGWVMLARAYRAMGRWAQADEAFSRVGAALDRDPVLLSEYAQVLATRAMGNFDGRPAELIERALKLDPNHAMALSLAATAAYNRRDLPTAIALWERLQKIVPPGSEDARWLAEAVAKVREEAATSSPAPAASAPAGGAAITGRVTLAPALAGRAQPGDTVFIFARAPQGPRMPLAVQRARVSQLPLDFKLDDSLAMSPELKLSGATEVRIEARISKSGSATPATGDLFGTGPVVKPGARGVTFEINQVRP